MKFYVGTSGYSYREWKGSFYPEHLSAKDMLTYYAQQLNAVEINSTFYRFPKLEVFESWAAQVPPHFHFALKASQRITHFKRLSHAENEVSQFLDKARSLGDKLGPVLFQLPPNLTKDSSLLEAFLDLLPADIRAAFEFRHESWFDDDTFTTLRARGHALCIADRDEVCETPFIATAPWGYLRLRRSSYTASDLAEWTRDVFKQNWSEAYVFFKHESKGLGPKLAVKCAELAKHIARPVTERV